MIPVIVLCAGFGTRLRPLTDERPKPLLWVGDRPQLAHIVAGLVAQGFRRVVVNAHHLAGAFDAISLGELAGSDEVARRSRASVVLSREERILGTAGGVQRAAPLLGPGPVLVYNGDISARVDLAGLVEAVASSQAVGASLVVGRHLPAGAGSVGLDRRGRVVRLRSFRRGVEDRGADYIGIAVLSEGLRATLPAVGCLVGDALLPWLEGGGEVDSFSHPGSWRDIGDLPSYLDANLGWLEERGDLAYRDRSTAVSPSVILDRSIVLPGARVEGEGRLFECVVWPDAKARAPLRRAVVTPRGAVPIG